MAGTSDERDPGWFSAGTFLWMLVPAVGLRRASREAANALQHVRLVFTSFALSLVLIGLVAVLQTSGEGVEESVSGAVAGIVVAAVGVLSLLAPRIVAPPLDCSSTETLVAGYRTRFFLRMAFANVAALVGFVGVFLSGEWWPYPLGAAFTAIGMARLAPTRRNLERDEESLIAAGCGRSLMEALTSG